MWSQHLAAFEQGRVPAPVPSCVTGDKQWQPLARHVAKGRPGYMVVAPVTGRFATTTPQHARSWRRPGWFEKPKPDEGVWSRLVGARPAYVRALSQTAGDPVARAAPTGAAGR